jgi:hypothetical protein
MWTAVAAGSQTQGAAIIEWANQVNSSSGIHWEQQWIFVP